MNLTLVIGLFLLVLFLIGMIGIKIIKIPDILLFILLGLILSLVIKESKVIEVAGEIGLVLLFFILGMKFPVKRLITSSTKIWRGGFLDAFLGIFVTAVISLLFGLDWVSSLIVGGIVYATSSSITAKLLEHKNRTQNKESEFMLLILVFEDLIAPILVTVLIGLTGDGFTVTDFLLILLKIVLLAGIAVFFAKVVFKKVESILKEIDQDDIFIVLITGIALTYGGIAMLLGLSEVIGAFLAGMMLSELSIKDKVEKAALPVRNIFLPFFFLNFGLHIEMTSDIPYLGLLIVLVLWSLIHKLIVGYIGGQWYGLSRSDSLKAGLSLTQRGEFSVIIAALATGELKIFASIYILVIAIIGTIMFQLAPRLNNMIVEIVKEKTN
ncbi:MULTISPECIES: cation:proton antiporter [Mesobacillus]|uniref:cation:proton antiporter n=1 Tax=Mesobacillus TaxID=2675231 RepID=UPI00177BBEB3|nr:MULTISPECIES: cation:proton antiporter [Mesobacillus]MCM3575124.1 cation:proton antiporter [Mesobacillus subterraneus]UYZ20160.1 cation:proton antiporter [Mesobacillus jeotgali]